jgi:F-type H+-transporting ATPase subunit alpha
LAVERQVAIIYAGTKGYLDAIPVAEVGAFEREMYQFIETRAPEVFRGIVEKKQLDDQVKGALDAAVSEFAKDFAARKAAAA